MTSPAAAFRPALARILLPVRRRAAGLGQPADRPAGRAGSRPHYSATAAPAVSYPSGAPAVGPASQRELSAGSRQARHTNRAATEPLYCCVVCWKTSGVQNVTQMTPLGRSRYTVRWATGERGGGRRSRHTRRRAETRLPQVRLTTGTLMMRLMTSNTLTRSFGIVHLA